jgi:nucleotide-binding universal stress UspA family protein
MINTPLESIIHPTDFSPAGLDAFAHALRLAVAAKSLFYIVHIQREIELDDWKHFPRVREMLAAWGMIAPDAPQSAMARELGLMVKKAIVNFDDPVRGVGTFVEQHPCDLLVLMTHARSIPRRWLQGSVAEAAARRARARTLFLREDQRGFVNRGTGVISLQTILLPFDGIVPHWEASRWVESFKQLVAPSARVHLLHVGSSTPANASELEGTIDVRQGPVVETIVAVAKEIGADIVAMPTAGHHGLLDAFRGSVTECVLHEAPCPVLAIPATEGLGAR